MPWMWVSFQPKILLYLYGTPLPPGTRSISKRVIFVEWLFMLIWPSVSGTYRYVLQIKGLEGTIAKVKLQNRQLTEENLKVSEIVTQLEAALQKVRVCPCVCSCS